MTIAGATWLLILIIFFFFPGVVPINAKAAELKFWTKNDGQVWTVVFLPLRYDVLRF